MSPLYSWMLVGACLLAAVGVAALLQAIRRPAPMVELAPELRGPARGSRWTPGDKFELVCVSLALVAGIALSLLGPWLDERAAQRDAQRVVEAQR